MATYASNLCVYAEDWGSSHLIDASPTPHFFFSLFLFISVSSQISVRNGQGNYEVGA